MGCGGAKLPTCTDGQVLACVGGVWTPRDDSYLFTFGDGGVNATNPGYMTPGYGNITSLGTTADNTRIPMPYSGRLVRLVVGHTNPTGATVITYTLRLNGANTALQLALASNAAGAAQVSASIPVTALVDAVSMQTAHALGVAISCRPFVIFELARS